MITAAIGPEDLRELVAQAVRELLPTLRPSGGIAPDPLAITPASGSRAPAQTETVRLESDADLAEFVRRLAALCGDRTHREAVLEGRIAYTLAGARGRAAGVKTVRRVERGPVSESMVVAAAAAGETLWLGRRATLTPLAKDKVRTLGIEVTKES